MPSIPLTMLILVSILIQGCLETVNQEQMIGQDLGPTIPRETPKKEIQVLFCPQHNCSDALIGLVSNADVVHCALFDLDIPDLIQSLERSGASVVVDETNEKDMRAAGTLSNVRFDTSSRFTHNKFCVFDNRIVWTGSFNPTINGDTKNDNNVLIIHSAFLAYNYAEEFHELWAGEFGKGAKVTYPLIDYGGVMIENYFCPEDCRDGPGGEQRLVELIDSAASSIEMAIFTLTLGSVGDALIRAKERGVEVTILLENRQRNVLGSEYQKLAEAGLDIILDSNPAAMHHKFVIIDGKLVWTGSFNFSNNANVRNDENIIIVHSLDIASIFSDEFSRLVSREQ